MEQNYLDLLAMVIISNENFANTYQLCKMLAWKFDVINCTEIIERIERKSYVMVTYPKSKTLKFFSLTSEGQSKLREGTESLIKFLKEEFPEERNFIDKLVSHE